MDLNELTKKLVLVSDLYAKRFAIDRSPDWYLLKAQEELGELVAAYLKSTRRARLPENESLKQNLQDEIADVVAMALLFAKAMDIDVEVAIREKWLTHLGAEGAD